MKKIGSVISLSFLILLLIAVSLPSVCFSDFQFKCPENLSTDEERKQSMKDFLDYCIKYHPNWTLKDSINYRLKLLEKHNCKGTLENISRKPKISEGLRKKTECLKPAPEIVVLSGKLVRRTYPGPPNYADIKKGDEPETGFYLLLNEPVCYVGDELSDPKQNVSLIQLVLDQKGYDELSPYLGKIIKLKGSLFGSHTGHHHTPILLEKIVLSEPINSQEYVEYCNERYGFCVNYPSNLKKERPPDNGDGQRFKDGKGFLMIVSGTNNALDDNLKTEMASQSKDFDKITYQTYKNNWFVLSGYKGSNIVYLKTYVGRSSINHLYIQFPSSQKNEYDNIVTIISRSFKSGNLNDYH